MTLKDHTNQIRTFDLDKMVEIRQGNNPNNSVHVKIERRDLKSRIKLILDSGMAFHFVFLDPQAVQLPPHWSPMTKQWERVFLARRDNTVEWSRLYLSFNKKCSNSL